MLLRAPQCIKRSQVSLRVLVGSAVGTLIGSSTLGLGDVALSAAAGVMGSSLTTSNMLGSSRSPLSSRGWGICRALVLLCRAPLKALQNRQHTSGGPWPELPFLHATPLDNLKFPGTPSGEGSPFTPAHPGKVMVHEPSFSCCVAASLKAMAYQQTIPLTWMSLKYSSLEWRRDWNSLHHSETLSFFAHRSGPTCLHGLDRPQSLSLGCLPGREVAMLEHRRWSRRCTRSISTLSRFYKLGDFWASLPRRMASSPNIGEVPHSSSVVSGGRPPWCHPH